MRRCDSLRGLSKKERHFRKDKELMGKGRNRLDGPSGNGSPERSLSVCGVKGPV